MGFDLSLYFSRLRTRNLGRVIVYVPVATTTMDVNARYASPVNTPHPCLTLIYSVSATRSLHVMERSSLLGARFMEKVCLLVFSPILYSCANTGNFQVEEGTSSCLLSELRCSPSRLQFRSLRRWRKLPLFCSTSLRSHWWTLSEGSVVWT